MPHEPQDAAKRRALLLAVIAFCAAACGGNANDSESEGATPTSAGTPTSTGTATGTTATGGATTGIATTSTDTDTTSAGTGGATNTADATTAGGVTATTATGGSGGSIDELPEANCNVTVMSSELGAIATVGIISFSADLPSISRAEIQFGKDESYGLVAPVDLSAPDHRTLLLGMTQESTYNYRIAVSDGSRVCYSDNQTIETGSLDVNDLEDVDVGADTPKGFIVTSRGGHVIIFNEVGELVWGYPFGGRMFSAQMSWDGQYMIARDVGPFDAGSGGTFRRMAMDGSGATSFDAPGGDHHDFTPIPGGIAYLGKTAGGECDRIFVASDAITDGEPLVDTWEIFQYFTEPSGGVGAGRGELCHANRIHYIADADVFTVSDRNKDAIAIFGRDGTPLTSIGKAPSGDWTQHIQAEGAGSEWRAQHGHHLYAEDKLLVFSNDGDSGSAMLHYTISGDSAVLDWSYANAGRSMTQGDVQHLPNGTFLVTASNAGRIHLIDASQSVISAYASGAGGAGGGGFGYAWFRTTLYGPPPSRP